MEPTLGVGEEFVEKSKERRIQKTMNRVISSLSVQETNSTNNRNKSVAKKHTDKKELPEIKTDGN